MKRTTYSFGYNGRLEIPSAVRTRVLVRSASRTVAPALSAISVAKSRPRVANLAFAGPHAFCGTAQALYCPADALAKIRSISRGNLPPTRSLLALRSGRDGTSQWQKISYLQALAASHKRGPSLSVEHWLPPGWVMGTKSMNDMSVRGKQDLLIAWKAGCSSFRPVLRDAQSRHRTGHSSCRRGRCRRRRRRRPFRQGGVRRSNGAI